eukprot:5946601-Prymnesium_polylepis.1
MGALIGILGHLWVRQQRLYSKATVGASESTLERVLAYVIVVSMPCHSCLQFTLGRLDAQAANPHVLLDVLARVGRVEPPREHTSTSRYKEGAQVSHERQHHAVPRQQRHGRQRCAVERRWLRAASDGEAAGARSLSTRRMEGCDAVEIEVDAGANGLVCNAEHVFGLCGEARRVLAHRLDRGDGRLTSTDEEARRHLHRCVAVGQCQDSRSELCS